MADEWRHVTIGDSVTNGGIDEIGEEGNSAGKLIIFGQFLRRLRLPVLKKAVGNLHDARRVLQDANFGRLLHLACSVQ
jgi:hypothetical protein